jgi:hypothetical protein
MFHPVTSSLSVKVSETVMRNTSAAAPVTQSLSHRKKNFMNTPPMFESGQPSQGGTATIFQTQSLTVRVKFTLEQATKDQSKSRCIFSLTSVLDLGGWSMLSPCCFTLGKILDRPAHSKSLSLLHYPQTLMKNLNFPCTNGTTK